MSESHFDGFEQPTSNYFKFPHLIIDELPNIATISEMKVMLYILRHTWGYQEFDEGKKITLDEFANGRKRRDKTRIDSGTGLSIPSIRGGINKAVEHGYISVETDESDPARVKNYYSLNMKTTQKQSVIQGVKHLHPECKTFAPGVKESLPRTEKDTKERNLGKGLPSSQDDNYVSVRALVDELGVLATQRDNQLFGDDYKDFSIDEWKAGIDTFKQRRKEKNEYLPYKFLTGILKRSASEQLQSAMNEQAKKPTTRIVLTAPIKRPSVTDGMEYAGEIANNV